MKSYKKIRNVKQQRVLILLVCSIVAIICVVAFLCINLFVTDKKAEEEQHETLMSYQDFIEMEEACKEELESAANKEFYELIYNNGGNIQTFYTLTAVLKVFYEYVDSGEYEKAYNMYAHQILDVAGYTYPYEDFVKDMEELKKSLNMTDGDKLVVTASYYKAYSDNYYVLYGAVGRKQKDGKYNEIFVRSFTVVPVLEGYAFFDFAWNDFDLYKYRFVPKEENTLSGECVDGVIVIPDVLD